jgi:hypothetical protein
MDETGYDQAKKSAKAIFLAPLILCLAIAGFSLIAGPAGLLAAYINAIVFVPLAWIVLIAAGIPVYWALYDLGIRGVWPLVTGGFLAGTAVGYLVFGRGHESDIVPAAYAALLGALVSAIAWGIRRPDLDPD